MTRDDDEEDDELSSLFGDQENPFAAAAEFAEHVRMTEALLFAAAEPLDEPTIAKRLPENAAIKDILEALQKQYENRGVTLSRTGKKWQFVTAPDVAHILQIEQVQPKKLSRAALETLAIIAYHQPCTRAEIEEVRGVAVSAGSLDKLLEIGWIRLRGRKDDTPGRPLLYGTSQEFLEHFGLESVSHLPGMADLKAAGLLDARLPPDFVVPTPRDGDEIETDENEPPETDFVEDFHQASTGADLEEDDEIDAELADDLEENDFEEGDPEAAEIVEEPDMIAGEEIDDDAFDAEEEPEDDR
ncbi:SMC-Scp complex subunit ScpB [Aquisalinus flavus]|nr:SMC-Scp complex subunit ScpB [Aquisalinus flavus]UNE49199.1 SMC-Scp complex subunit ScpB [Aquisalinus flavus]